MNLQRLTMLITLVALMFCYVVCTKVERQLHPEFHNGDKLGSSDGVGKGRLAVQRDHMRRLVNPISINNEVETVHRLPNIPGRQVRPGKERNKDFSALSGRGGKYQVGRKAKVDLWKCLGQKDGVYAAGPCERWYLLCKNGKGEKINCPRGLYWNGDRNQCEPEVDIISCRSKFDCSGMGDGIYVDGCSNTFRFCTSGSVSFFVCSKDLYFNINELKCDRKELVPACRNERIRSPKRISQRSSEDWKKQVEHLEFDRDGGICEELKNGKYAISQCYGKFLFCIDGKSLIVDCHDGQLYSPELRRCVDAGTLPACLHSAGLKTSTVAATSISCSSLPDGTYKLGDCERTFFICRNGVRSNASCNPGFVYNAKTGHCNHEYNVEKCPQFQEGNVYDLMGSYKKQNVCRSWENGMYEIAKCYGKYLFCIDGRGLVVICSDRQLFSPEHQRCMDVEQLPGCTDFVSTEKTTSARYSDQCSTLPDGTYELGSCERKFLICFNGEGSINSCRTGLVYNGQSRDCELMSKVKECSRNWESKRRRDESPLLRNEEDCRCMGKEDGLYAVGCTEKFYSCSNGIAKGLECPSGLVFNVNIGFCDFPTNVVVCGGQRPVINDKYEMDQEKITSDLVSGCSIMDDGIYGLSPCGPGYYHCLHGATSFAKCASDLVFNPSLNMCDSRKNVPNCPEYNKTSDNDNQRIQTPATDDSSKCENLSDGFYVSGCNSSYYVCKNGKIHQMFCPQNFAFNQRTGACDNPNNIESCRDMKSEKIHPGPFSSFPLTMPSCTNLSNGLYRLAHCSPNYIFCKDGVISLGRCPNSTVYDSEKFLCAERSQVAACKTLDQLNKNKFDVYCAGQMDGILSYNCSKNFFICAAGKTYPFACPDGLIYDRKFSRCGKSSAVQSCAQTDPSKPPLQQKPLKICPSCLTTKDDGFCNGRPDGNYAAGPCSNSRKLLMLCHSKLVYDVSINRCQHPDNVAECRNHSISLKHDPSDGQDASESLTTSTIAPFCVGRGNSIYEMEPCSRNYIQCFNQEGIIKQCPENMVFSEAIFACIPTKVCNQQMPAYEKPKQTENDDNKSEKLPAPVEVSRCYELADGEYSAGCVPDFIRCIDGSEFFKKCPNYTVFSNILRQCVSYDRCAFLMHRILSSLHPSHRVDSYEEWMKYERARWMKQGSTANSMDTTTVSAHVFSSPQPINSVNESCKYARVHCLTTTNGVPVYGWDMNHCEYAAVQCIDPGYIAYGTPETPESQIDEKPDENENHFCLPEISSSETDSIRCENLEDGIYALDCSDKVVVCSRGWKRIYECPTGQLFIPALKKCDESWRCTDASTCGSGFVGVIYLGRIETFEQAHSPPSIGGFSCVNRESGNYGRQCSPVYFKCIQRIPLLMRCQEGRLFDQRSGQCMSYNRCPMLSTTLDIGTFRCLERERFGIATCTDHYYQCSNGKFILYKCPSGYSFDPNRDDCSQECDHWSNKPACTPGEVASLGRCKNTYMECSAQGIFRIKYCMKDQRFDSVLHICRFSFEIPECFENSLKRMGNTSIPRVYDSFKYPVNPYLIRQSRNPYQLKIPYPHWSSTMPNSHPEMLSGQVQVQPHGLFMPQTNRKQYGSHFLGGSVSRTAAVEDAFQVSSSLYWFHPEIPKKESVDHFWIPGVQYRFHASTPSPPYDSTTAFSFIRDDAMNRMDNVEGSGEGDNASAATEGGRVKRDVISFERELPGVAFEFGTGGKRKLETDSDEELQEGSYFAIGSSLCPSNAPANITLGHCRPNYIFCNIKENFVSIMDCNDGELFDRELKKCSPALDCILRALENSNDNQRTPCALLPDGTYSIPGCSQYFLSCESGKAILRSCANDYYYDGSEQQCNPKELVPVCNDKSHSNFENAIDPTKVIEAGNAEPEVQRILPNFTCSVNSTISLGCSPSFVICAGIIGYVFKCDDNLVFDQGTSSCNRRQDTFECFEVDKMKGTLSIAAGFSSVSSIRGFDDLPHTSVNLTRVSNDTSSFDCTNTPDGLYAPQCSPIFFVCSANHIAGFVCQDESVFNLETGFCEQSENVPSCKGADHLSSPQTLPATEEIPSQSTDPTVHESSWNGWKCEKGFHGIMTKGCSREFVLCINGDNHLFFCNQGEVFNIKASRCEEAGKIDACNYKAENLLRKKARDLQVTEFSNQTIRSFCDASIDQSVAYGRCQMSYIYCPRSGTPRKSYCSISYLFDEDIGRCVPSKVCGMLSDPVARSVSLENWMCDAVEDGIPKGIGPCFNEYYVCRKGIPIRRRCTKKQATFSRITNACVPRSQNPECAQTLSASDDEAKEYNDTNDFCIHHSDGLYRHPTDCTRILQCFGKEMFEYLPCNDGLVFNEISGSCDYISNVPECAGSFGNVENGSSCGEHVHGDHLADAKDCSVFYRCVWGKLEKFSCPDHAVFNPILSVCDLPSAVPYCKVTM